MYNKGFLKVACVTPDLELGHPKFNVSKMIDALKSIKAGIALFPELAITGYNCGDLFYQESLSDDALKALSELLEKNPFDGFLAVGMPFDIDGVLYNVAVVIKKHQVLGMIPKKYLPNTGEFYEKRWFNSGLDTHIKQVKLFGMNVPFGDLLFQDLEKGIKFGVEICQDMWTTISPGNLLSLAGANMILNLSASNEYLYKEETRRTAVIDHSRRNNGAYLYASSGMMESSADTVFSGHNMVASAGTLVKEEFFNEPKTQILYADIDFGEINYKRRRDTNLKDVLHRLESEITYVDVSFDESSDYTFTEPIDQTPFVPKKNIKKDYLKIKGIQIQALMKRLIHLGNQKLIIGVSGGLDSTLALMIAYETMLRLGRPVEDIIGVTMPGLGTSSRTKNNALELMKKLGITHMEKPIIDETNLHFDLIGHDKFNTNITYENTQARIRTMVLMNLANMHNGIVLGTGDLSEIALGFMTYNGDQMSMYGINAGLPKTLVSFMVLEFAKEYPALKTILEDVVDTPISPELIKDQVTENILGKYVYNDFLLHRHLRCGDDEEKLVFMIKKTFNIDEELARSQVAYFLRRFYQQQFKRQTLPDSPKVLDISLSPRGDYRMPSDIKKW
jgi:NAD+ synthase (glutamine-hydrolysing)